MTSPILDPFTGSGEKHPSFSWKDRPVGYSVTGTVVEAPRLVQGRDIDSGDPATWPDGNPKMVVVTVFEVDGETYSLWAPKPSALFAAMGAAQTEARAKITEGGTLTVTFTGEKRNESKPRLNPQKLYSVRYVPPAAADAFAPGRDLGTAGGDLAKTPQSPAEIPPAPAERTIPAPSPAAPGDPLAALAQIKELAASGLTADQICAIVPTFPRGAVEAVMSAA